MKTIKTATERMAPGAPAHDIIPCMLEEIMELRAALAATEAPQPDVSARDATRLVCLEAAQKLRTYVGIYPGDKQAKRLIDELSNIGTAAPESAEPSAEAVTNKAHGMYRAMVDSSGIHENRFAGWRELSALMQEEWKGKARAALATSSAAKGTSDE